MLCRECAIDKEPIKFDKNRLVCRNCRYLARKARRMIENTSRQKHRLSEEQIKQNRHEYYVKNRQAIIAKSIKYRTNHPEKSIKNSQKYRQNHLNERKTYDKEYRTINKEKRKLQNRINDKKRMISDPSFKIRKNLRNSIYCALIRNKSTKNKLSILNVLPYTMEELKQHLESQFEPWMTWDNWGIYTPETWDDNNPSTWTWQLDHIVPHSMFIYKSMDDEEFKKCWALNNLRPYSAKQNCLDNNRRGIK